MLPFLFRHKIKILISLGTLILLVIGLVAYAVLNLGALIERNKSLLLAQAEQKLNRKMTVDAIEASIWGGLGIRLKKVTLADDPAFSTQEFIHAEDLQINLQLWPLLQKKLEISRLILHDPKITVIRDEKGQMNISTLAKPAGEKPVTEPATPTKTQTAAGQFLLSFLDMRNGELSFRDKQEKKDFTIKQINFSVNDLGIGQKGKVHFSAAVQAEKPNLNYDGTVGPITLPFDVYTLPIEGKLEVNSLPWDKIQALTPALKSARPPELGINGPLSVQMLVSGKGKTLSLSQIKTQIAVLGEKKPNLQFTGNIGPLGSSLKEIKIQGDMQLDPMNTASLRRLPMIAEKLPKECVVEGSASLKGKILGNIASMSLSGDLEASGMSLKYGEKFNKSAGMPLRISLDGQWAESTLTLRKTQIKLHTLELSGSGTMALSKNPAVNLTFQSGKTELRGWDQVIALLKDYDLSGAAEMNLSVQGTLGKDKIPNVNGFLALSGVKAKAPQLKNPILDLNSKITFNGTQAEIQESSMKLGKSQFQFRAKAEKISPLSVSYSSNIPQLWLADFQSGTAASESNDVLKEVKDNGRLWMEKETIFCKGSLTSPQGTLYKSDYTDLKADYSLNGKIAKIDSLTMKTMEGVVQANGTYDFSGPTPKFSLTTKNQSLNLSSVLSTVSSSVPKNLKGKLNFDLSLTGSGKNWQEMKPTLDGQGALELVDGALLDLNVAQNVLSGLSGIPGLGFAVPQELTGKYPQLFSTQNTTFDQMKGSLNIQNGKISFKNLAIAAADWAARAEGWYDLDKNVNSNATLNLSPKFSADIAQYIQPLKYLMNEKGQIEVPFSLVGALPSIKPQLDMSFVTKTLQQSVLRQGIDNLQTGKGGGLIPQVLNPNQAQETSEIPTSPRRQAAQPTQTSPKRTPALPGVPGLVPTTKKPATTETQTALPTGVPRLAATPKKSGTSETQTAPVKPESYQSKPAATATPKKTETKITPTPTPAPRVTPAGAVRAATSQVKSGTATAPGPVPRAVRKSGGK